uniref:serine protease 40-like isoform X1 n=1 Tax=Styela clava TaxID=7725 RepID=UPI00193962B8|nr:serine protease 40-like isoform X1 [Styela clava]
MLVSPQSIAWVLLLSTLILVSVECEKRECSDKLGYCAQIKEYCNSTEYVVFLKENCFKTCFNCTELDCGDCEDGCTESDNGEITCTCYPGFKLSSDGKSCQDINECLLSPCPSNKKWCKNFEGGFSCHRSSCSEISINYSSKMHNPNECCHITHGKCGQDGWTRYPSLPRRPINKWPWTAALYTGRKLKCTGVIIDKNSVVIPTSCVRKVVIKSNLKQLQVKVGLMGFTSTPYSVRRNVLKLHTISGHKSAPDNVTLLQLNESLPFSMDLIHPVCTSGEENPSIGETCVALGFVKRDSFDGLYDSLTEIPLTVTNNSECRTLADDHDYGIDEYQVKICAGNQKLNNKDCLGSSGGLLVCQSKCSCDWYLAGVKYEGKGCAGPRQGYTSFLNLITFQTAINNLKDDKNSSA